MPRTMHRLLFVIVILVAGCAGRQFVRPQPEALVLGRTTHVEVFRQLGEPYQRGMSLKEGQTVMSISYAYSTATGTSGFGGVEPARAMQFHFVKDVLVGYEFTSSYKEDLTDFDDSKIAQIKKGQTTRAEVEQLLGRPEGIYAYPMIKNTSERALVYLYIQTRTALFSVKVNVKKLLVAFDRDEVVTDVEFTTSGER